MQRIFTWGMILLSLLGFSMVALGVHELTFSVGTEVLHTSVTLWTILIVFGAGFMLIACINLAREIFQSIDDGVISKKNLVANKWEGWPVLGDSTDANHVSTTNMVTKGMPGWRALSQPFRALTPPGPSLWRRLANLFDRMYRTTGF